MKKIIFLAALSLVLGCNNSSKKDGGNGNSGSIDPHTDVKPPAKGDLPADLGTYYTVDGKDIHTSGSLLVTKDPKHLQPGADYLVVLTASGGGDNNEGMGLNFLIDLKPGTYPIVGWHFRRGPTGKAELYGGIMGGEEKLTGSSITITSCENLGSNNMGGHRWRLSGSFENLTIPAMGIMLADKSKNHPTEVKIEEGKFLNLTFDDNWEEVMKRATGGNN